MLTSLLPGIRDLRAPLGAGYLWLVALGFILEPHVPDRADATGFMESIYRLADSLSVVGLGVAASFAAYLIGSLSMAMGTTPLQKLTPTSLVPEQAGTWNSLPSASLQALMHAARDARERLEALLALSDTNLGAELQRWVEPSQRFRRVTAVDRLIGLIRFRPRARSRSRSRRVARLSHDSPAPPPPEAEQERILFRALVDDLDVVTTTRLLGRDPDLYSAIDRNRAEAEFRLAIIPPLLATGFVIGWRLGALSGSLVAIGAVAFAVGLLWDAIRHQRDANALLVDALSDGRVTSPTVDRLEARARERATQSKIDALRSSASNAASAIARAIGIVEGIPSAPSAVVAARRAVDEARERFEVVVSTSAFPSAAVERGTKALQALDGAVRLWQEAIGKPTPPSGWSDQVRMLVNEAKAHHESYRDTVREELQRVRAPGPPQTAPPARLREDQAG
jgi:hypothetical protein